MTAILQIIYFFFFFLLGKGHSQEDSVHVQEQACVALQAFIPEVEQSSSPEGQILNRSQQKSP